MNLGMGLLPDDRKAEGIIGDLSVRENIILAMQAKQGIFKKIPMAKQIEIADKFIEMLQIKTASRETLIKQLSGGNQQKAILARWLATNPDFLIFHSINWIFNGDFFSFYFQCTRLCSICAVDCTCQLTSSAAKQSSQSDNLTFMYFQVKWFNRSRMT